MMHDVVVVGGGPAGCYAASLLARTGLDVHLLEEHSVIGEPVDCSGVIGWESFNSLGFPPSLILANITSITFVSPSDLKVHFSPPSPLACVVDRAAFDRLIAESAAASGATFHLGSRVIDIEVSEGGVDVVIDERRKREQPKVDRRKTLRARVAILANGPRYKLQRKLGMGEPSDFLKTAQTEVPIRGLGETRVLLGSQVAPGSFGWVVPFKRDGQDLARIGVSAKEAAAPYLTRLLQRLRGQGHLDASDVPVRSWVIPVAPLKKTYSHRVLAVGDAAGQTKPTTGGGIYYSLLSAKAAAETVAAAFKKGDFSATTMRRYQREWRKRLSREIRLGAFFRHLAERLRDRELDELFQIVQSDGVLSMVTKKARFDWHADVIHLVLRHPALGKIFLRGLFR